MPPNKARIGHLGAAKRLQTFISLIKTGHFGRRPGELFSLCTGAEAAICSRARRQLQDIPVKWSLQEEGQHHWALKPEAAPPQKTKKRDRERERERKKGKKERECHGDDHADHGGCSSASY